MGENTNTNEESTSSYEELSEILNAEEAQETTEINEPETLDSQLDKEKAISAGYLDRLQRTLAEFDNFRKRSISEKSQIYDNGFSDSIEKFLPILDNFERALLSINDEEKDSSLYKGISMILSQFLTTLKDMDINEIASIGDTFNPKYHNAVMHIEDEDLDKNVVAEVLQKGYKYKDKVIRPAMVKVAN